MSIIKTLIVDDEARIRRSIERMVQQSSGAFEVVATCADGKEALEYMHNHHGEIDLVISDVKMPEMDGTQFIQAARKNYHFASLFISGYDDFEYLQTAIREGAVDYILKPIDREKFHERLLEISQMILAERLQLQKAHELEKKAELLLQTRQTQALIEATSSSIDLARLGYWVETFPAGCFVLLNISLDVLPVKTRTYTDQDWKAYSYALENIITEVAQSSVLHNWIWQGDYGFWMLLHEDGQESEDQLQLRAMAVGQQICLEIRRHTPFTVSIAVSQAINDLYLIRSAMQQALNYITYRLVYGGNQVFHMDNRLEHCSANEGNEKMDAAFLQAVQRLKLSLQHAKYEQAVEHFNSCFYYIEASKLPHQVQWLSQYLYIQIHTVWMEMTETNSHNLEQELQAFKKSNHVAEIKRSIHRQLEKVIKQLELERALHQEGPLEQAKTWIAKNLQHELTIKQIADYIYMNPTYFCKYFKTQTGETVLDYITRLRMEQAKALLVNRQQRLQEICEAVGYKDVKYFSKLFKQWVGVTPSQYREARY